MMDQWNEDAVTAMVRKELPQIYNVCFRLCGHREEAEDLVQETFVKAVRALAKFRGEANMATWLYRIAVNNWKNRIRHESRRMARRHVSLSGLGDPEREDSSIEMELADPTQDPTHELGKKEGIAMIAESLESLEEDDKAIIVLKDIDQRSYEDISQIMGLNLGTVKSRLSRAREKFREAFNSMGVKKR